MYQCDVLSMCQAGSFVVCECVCLMFHVQCSDFLLPLFDIIFKHGHMHFCAQDIR